MTTSEPDTPDTPGDGPKKEWTPPQLEVVPIDETELHLLTTADGGTGHS
jgi:hypothetical protein